MYELQLILRKLFPRSPSFLFGRAHSNLPMRRRCAADAPQMRRLQKSLKMENITYTLPNVDHDINAGGFTPTSGLLPETSSDLSQPSIH
eukprot:scaffold298951_cov28-Attheya_sp.AAC.1